MKHCQKATTGFSLVELLIVTAILVMITASASGALFSLWGYYAANRQIQHDQQHADLALLAITRDTRMSKGVIYAGHNTLVLATGADEEPIIYGLDGQFLTRSAPQDWPSSFGGATIGGFIAYHNYENRLTITITGTDGLELGTTVSLQRFVP